MTPTPRALAATTAAALALAALAGCSSSRASGEPVTPDPATVQAQKEAAKAAAYMESEEAIRAYVTDLNRDRMRPPSGWYASPKLIDEQTQILDEFKNRGLTIKGSSSIVSIEPIDYQGAPMYQAGMRVCSTITGGIYDSKGRNVTTTPEGKPLADKQRRIAERYAMHQNGSTKRWQIDYVRQEGTC